jgi:RNA polymerase sigma-70 factor (sigma-E family)
MTAAESGDMADSAARLTAPVTARAGSGAVPAAWDADAAVSTLYAAHYKGLVGLAALLVQDRAAAEEVVQDSFVAMHAEWRRVREADRALSYLRRSVINRSRSVLRRGVVTGRAVSAPPADAPGAEQDPMALPEGSALVAALHTLPLRQREALVLQFYADMSPAEAASVLGISVSAVSGHTARALSSLRSTLDAQA